MEPAIKLDVPEDVVREQSENISKILSPFTESFALLGESIRIARLKTFEKTFTLASAICVKHNIQMRELPIKILIPLAEKCSYEDENSDMVLRWASLLASSAQDSSQIHPSYVDILSQLNNTDAIFLKSLWIQMKDKNINEFELFCLANPQKSSLDHMHPNFGPLMQKYAIFISGASYYGLEPGKSEARTKNFKSMQILERQNLIKIDTRMSTDVSGRNYFETYAVLTPLGYDFTAACEKFND